MNKLSAFSLIFLSFFRTPAAQMKNEDFNIFSIPESLLPNDVLIEETVRNSIELNRFKTSEPVSRDNAIKEFLIQDIEALKKTNIPFKNMNIADFNAKVRRTHFCIIYMKKKISFLNKEDILPILTKSSKKFVPDYNIEILSYNVKAIKKESNKILEKKLSSLMYLSQCLILACYYMRDYYKL